MIPVQKRFALDFEWRGFELHPEIPPGGIELTDMYPAALLRQMLDRLEGVAEEMGVPFTSPTRAPNTQHALTLSEFARRQGKLDPFRTVAMDAYWADGGDLEDLELLGELATAAGLDRAAALAFLDDDSVPALLQEQRRMAVQWGVSGIPTWFLLPSGWSPGDPAVEGGPRPVRVVGCQPLDVVERAARMAGASEAG